MSFLVPSVLWGLSAAAIPLIIHLVSTRRTQKIDFSTIRFIKALEHETIWKLKLRQWVLLFLRTLAIILLILVFARPVKVGYFPAWASNEKTTKMVFLVDNSASMSATFEDESLLARSKKILHEIVERVQGRLYVDIYQTSPLSRRFSGEFISSDQIKDVLPLIQESERMDNLWEAINGVLTETELETRGLADVANREFYILSDFPTTIDVDWKPASAYPGAPSSDFRYYLFPQPEVSNNVAVQTTEVVSQLRLVDHLISVGAEVKNQTHGLRKSVPVQLYFDGDRVGQVVSDFPPFESKHFVFQAFPSRTGSVRGVIEIPEDDYELDNRRFVQFSIPPMIHCKLVGSSADELSLIAIALSSISQDSLFVEFRQVFYSTGSLSLENNDILILVDPGGLDRRLVNEISRFRKAGGKILAFLGKRFFESNDYSLTRDLFLPQSHGLASLGEAGFHEVTGIREEHPLFTDFLTSDLGREMPRVYSHVRVTASDQNTVIMSLSNGDPFLLEVNALHTRMIVFTTVPDLRWTDLPVRGFFVPLIHRILAYLASSESQLSSVEVGAAVQIPLKREFISSELELVSPGGRKTKLVPDYRRELVTVEGVDEAGIYRLLSDGTEVVSFVANISPTENPTARLEPGELLRLFPGGRTRLVWWDENALAAVMEARRGTELWRVFLIAAIAILAAETWIGRVRNQRTTS